jgi:hypothetical protein
MDRVHATLVSLLACGGAGLTVAAVWVVGLPTYACAEGVARPSDWIYAGLVLFAGGILVAGLLGAALLEDTRIPGWVYFVIALVEAVTALALALHLSAKYSHYECG